jgi:hypothetical protein
MSTKTIQALSHFTYALKDNQVGIIHYWGFKDIFMFLNFEIGKVEKNITPSDVKIISRQQFDKLYKERNVHEGNDREKLYGKLHEVSLNIMGAGTTQKTGKWSMDFGRDVMAINGTVGMYKEICQHYGELKLDEIKGLPLTGEIAMKHLMPSFKSEKMSLCDKVFEELISEEEIKQIFEEYNSLPEDWKRVKPMSEESDFYLKNTPASGKLKVEKTDINKIQTQEQAFVQNLKSNSVKVDYKGHVVYGRGIIRELTDRVEERVKEGKSEVDVVRPYINTKIFLDSQCYYCGKKICYNVKSATEIEVFATIREEGGSFRTHDKEDHTECELTDKKKRVHKFDLTFPSGQVMLANYFSAKGDRRYLFCVPKDEEYGDKYSLQTVKGRFSRQDYVAKTHNAGYAQMGNMGVDIFVSKDKTRIIIGKEPEYTIKTHKKFNDKFKKEFTHVGYISLQVWRWECVDKEVWETYENRENAEDVLAEVIPGMYEVTHSDTLRDYTGKYSIYSEIKLKKNQDTFFMNKIKTLQSKKDNGGLTKEEEKEFCSLNSKLTGLNEKVFTKEFGDKLDEVISKTDKLLKKHKLVKKVKSKK